MRPSTKAACAKRLSRIEGQVRGISRMIEQDRYCLEVLGQLHAVRAALRAVEDVLLGDHVAHCVENAVASGDTSTRREKVDELLEILARQRD
jgi:DNA-binding FrmR family transcriptional regulator